MKASRYAIEPPADMSTLPDPPVPFGLDLRHFDCMHLNTERLLKSNIWDECTDAEIACALRLWAESWRQVPCSSLPNNDVTVRRLAGCEGKNRRWIACRFGALRNYYLANDGRLYHHVIAETANGAATKSRAGKRGAKVKWDNVKALKNNNTGHATAHGKANGTSDDTLYSNGDGKTDGKGYAEKGREYLPLIPPSLATPGSGSLDAPSARSPAQTRCPPEDPEIDVGGGVIFAINAAGNCDLVTSPRDAIIPEFTKAEALELRNRALNETHALQPEAAA